MAESLMLYEQVYEVFAEFNGAEVDLTAHVGFTITSMKLKIAAAEKNENLSLDEILKIINYGPTVLSIKKHWDDGKDTILHRVVRSNVKGIVGVILNAILIECANDKEKICQYLNFENSEIQTPLTLAVKYGCENSVEILLQNGIQNGLDINRTTSFEQNPLKIATFQFQNSSKIIQKLLLEYGAKLSP